MRSAILCVILGLMGCTHTSVVVTTVVTKVAKGSQEFRNNELMPDPVEILKAVPEGEDALEKLRGEKEDY